VLDEATAMLDPEGERAFLEEIGELMKSKTVLFITHRPASLALADRVVSLEGKQNENELNSIFPRSTLEEPK